MARRILLADDSVTAQNMGRRILTDAGYEVITVNNGSAALKKVAEAPPDLIVLDVYMPGYGGLEVCQRLKENAETTRIPVLLTVGKLEPFKPEEARRVRADAFIIKPFEATELLTALTKLEDKIVAQPLPQKSGRIASALAAVERSDTGDRFGDKETGWKNRLKIPLPGAKRSEAEPGETPPEPVAGSTRDADSKPIEPSREFERPIPAGLPTDITPDEIAALAAAAAAIEGRPAEEAGQQTAADRCVADLGVPDLGVPDPGVADLGVADFGVAQAREAALTAPVEPAPAEAPPATLAPAAEEISEISAHASAAPILQTPSDPAASPELARNIELAKGQEAPPAAELPPAVPAAAPEPGVALEAKPSQAESRAADDEVMAALATLAPANGHGDTSAVATAEGSGSFPALAGTSRAAGPRWIAEAAALTAEEAALCLEREMEREMERAARAAGDGAKASATAVAEIAFLVSPVEAAAATDLVVPAALGVIAGTDAVAQAVVTPEAPAAQISTSQPEVAAASAAEAAAQVAEPVVERSEAAFAAAASAGAVADPGPAVEAVAASQPAESTPASIAESAPPREAGLAAAWENWKQIRESMAGGQAPAPVETAPAEVSAPPQPTAESTGSQETEVEIAESASEPPAESAEIASIVDSMLAELRPKLVEEIAKKMGAEKKDKQKDRKKKR